MIEATVGGWNLFLWEEGGHLWGVVHHEDGSTPLAVEEPRSTPADASGFLCGEWGFRLTTAAIEVAWLSGTRS